MKFAADSFKNPLPLFIMNFFYLKCLFEGTEIFVFKYSNKLLCIKDIFI